MDTKEKIITALRAFISQRPGLQFANYGDVSAYRAEMRQITRDRHHAETLLNAVAWRDSITANDLILASKHSYSGRLSIIERDDGSVTIDYCTGQYFPTEYRKAVCAVLAQAIWEYYRKCMPAPTLHHNSETGETLERYKGMRAGDYLRHTMRREFGRTIGNRWFS